MNDIPFQTFKSTMIAVVAGGAMFMAISGILSILSSLIAHPTEFALTLSDLLELTLVFLFYLIPVFIVGLGIAFLIGIPLGIFLADTQRFELVNKIGPIGGFITGASLFILTPILILGNDFIYTSLLLLLMLGIVGGIFGTFGGWYGAKHLSKKLKQDQQAIDSEGVFIKHDKQDSAASY